jgi:hypothetical protein
MTALSSMPLWFKRCGSLLPANSANESDIIAYDGRLILASFNREAPLAQQVIFYDISDPANPVQLAAKSWPGGMGCMAVDAVGGLHIYGSSPAAQNSAPYNSLIHSSVDANWNISTPTTIIGPSGIGFNNVGVSAVPGGYVLAVEQAYSNGNKAESYLFSTSPDFSTYTVKSAFYNPGSGATPTVDFTGRSRLRTMPDGWTYITSDTAAGYCRIARTQDFVNFKFSTNTFGFLGPGPQDAYPGYVGGNPFYDGNVSWEQWTFQGAPCVYGVYFYSNETTTGSLMTSVFLGSLSDLFARFTFQP